MDDSGIFLIWACGFRIRSSPNPGVGVGGMVPRPEIAVWDGLPFASSDFGDFRDFRVHGPRMRIDDVSAPSGRFIARVPATVTTVDCRPGRGEIFSAADTTLASLLPCPLREARSLQKPSLQRRLSLSMLLPRRALHREPTSPQSRIRPLLPFRRLATRRLRLPCRLRAASPLGCAEEQPLPMPLSYLL